MELRNDFGVTYAAPDAFQAPRGLARGTPRGFCAKEAPQP